MSKQSDEINVLLAKSELTGYELAKLATLVCQEHIREQMMYNYIAKKLIPSFVNADGAKRVSHDDAVAWLTKFASKRGANVDVLTNA
jgi:hypothetical protein